MAGRVTVVGLGPGDPDLRTLAACRALADAQRIILRTAIHPGIADVAADVRTVACDDLYENLSSFDDVYGAIVERVIEAGRTLVTVYAVPGHPRLGERTVEILVVRAQECGIPLRVLPGVSALDVVGAALDVDLLADQVQLIDAVALDAWLHSEPFGGGLLDISPARPILVSQVYSREMASAVKLALTRLFPDHHLVRVVTAAGVPGAESVVECPLHRLDQMPVDHLTSVWVPALPSLEATRSAATLHRLAGTLRSPNGCPWDRKQTHDSLRTTVIEEAHEVVDAIDEQDPEHLADELGDLVLQVALHAQIAEERGEFTIEDVYDHVNRKLVRRHPHVFGSTLAATPEDVVTTWQGVKAEERRQRGAAPSAPHPFDKLPRSMPILTRVAQTLKANGVTPSADVPEDLANQLFAIVEQMVVAGLDPERELERAMRERMSRSSVDNGARSALGAI
jgi:tetrapyrrole methylase family protein/MazG family protein